MPRNAEVTRQWKILQAIESSRTGKTLEQLADLGRVCTRTIRRDLTALQEAGFALYDERTDDGPARWKLEGHPFKSLQERSFTIAELAALYFSRTLLEGAVAQPFHDDLKSAFARIDKALSPRMREFLAELPSVLTAKHAPGRHPRTNGGNDDIVAPLMRATLDHRKASITYYSFSSRKVKDYEIEPYRLAYGNGALYLFAFVRAYQQMRTFAVERIKRLTVLEETFSPVEQLPPEPFGNSIGIHVGEPEHVEIEFFERVAPYIKERTWHATQVITQQQNGSLVLSLDVCLDWALTSWILSFGPLARVIAPAKLAEEIYEEIEDAHDVYAPPLFPTTVSAGADAAARVPDSSRPDTEAQHVLPFSRRKRHQQSA